MIVLDEPFGALDSTRAGMQQWLVQVWEEHRKGGPARPAGRHGRGRPGRGHHRGAQALGLDGLVGSLESGKRADLVRLPGDRPGLANVHDLRQQIVYCASVADVADVWVDGARRVADGRLVGHDLAALVEAELVVEAGLGEHSRLA